MPQYKKVFDIGTYTGNGGQYRVGIPTLRSVGPSGFQDAGSTRFRQANSQYMTRTPAGAGNRKTWTWSGWIKRGSIGSNQQFFMAYSGASDSGNFEVRFNSSDYLYIYGWSSTWRATTQVFKDTTSWFHVVMSIDTTQATANDRIKLFINGAQVTSFSTTTNPTQNQDLGVNSVGIHRISGNGIPDGLFLDGYMSQVYFVDGQALTPSSFGEYNSDGIWVAKAYSGTYGTNGFYLPMNSSANYATDQSGNGNNFTPSGFNVTTANTTYDIMTDSPTDYLSGSMTTANNAANYPTVNPNNKYSTITLTNGNLTVTPSEAAYRQCLATTPFPSTGLYYLEINSTNQNYVVFGVATQNAVLSERTGASATGYAVGTSTNQWDRLNNGTLTGNFWTIGALTNPVYQIAIDTTNGKLWMGYNNTWLDSSGGVTGNPSTGANATYTIDTTRTYYAVFGGYNSNSPVLNVNFGQRAFTYTPPTSFLSLNTYNYPRPTDSSLWFYGNTPDLMWIKNRSTTGLHTLTDTVRGMGLNLVTSSTAAETSYPAVTEINKFGMSVINDGTSIVNGSGNGMIYWAWKKGVTPGFDIQTYTGDSNNNTLISHSLGAAPSFFITKNLDGYNNSNSFNDWSVYHTSLPSYNTTGSQALYLHSTNAAGAAGGFYQRPTSTKFTPNQTLYDNVSGKSYIAYLWAAIPGYSAFGSYTGNGSADGPFVYLGFRPRWIMIKVTSTIDHWILYDTVRSDYNPADDRLFANLTNAESASDNIDILSNGFKLRSSTTVNNTSSGTYIYAAFAEIPFKYARSR